MTILDDQRKHQELGKKYLELGGRRAKLGAELEGLDSEMENLQTEANELKDKISRGVPTRLREYREHKRPDKSPEGSA